jgi:hypothetical protein
MILKEQGYEYDDHIVVDGERVKNPNFNLKASKAADKVIEPLIKPFFDGLGSGNEYDQLTQGMVQNQRLSFGAVTVQDIKVAVDDGSISLAKNADGNVATTFVFGGCNMSGYEPYDWQVVFTTEVSGILKATVWGARGKSSPYKHYTTTRKANDWAKTVPNPDGGVTITHKGSNNIDLSNPEKKVN